MALITISGYPCSGKTTRAAQLNESFEQYLKDPSYHGPFTKVMVLSDDHLNLGRHVYNGRFLLYCRLVVHFVSR